MYITVLKESKCLSSLEILFPIIIIISKSSLLHFILTISTGSNPGSRALTGSQFLFNRQNFSKDMGGS